MQKRGMPLYKCLHKGKDRTISNDDDDDDDDDLEVTTYTLSPAEEASLSMLVARAAARRHEASVTRDAWLRLHHALAPQHELLVRVADQHLQHSLAVSQHPPGWKSIHSTHRIQRLRELPNRCTDRILRQNDSRLRTTVQ